MQLMTPMMMDPQTPAVRDADKINMPPLPPTAGYETWRFQASAAVLAAAARPTLVAAWLEEVDDHRVSFHALSTNPPTNSDCRLLTPILTALGNKGATLAEN